MDDLLPAVSLITTLENLKRLYPSCKPMHMEHGNSVRDELVFFNFSDYPQRVFRKFFLELFFSENR